MKEVKRFIIGSRAIFTGYKDFEDYTTDTDILLIHDDPDYWLETQYHDPEDDNIHYICWANISKEDLLYYHIHNVYMGTFIQKFLCPEYAEWLGLTIEELASMERLLQYMDNKHSYEKIVFYAYIKNGGFYMTDEQKAAAYEEYKLKRQDEYKLKERT